ncbi:NAD(P)/FAD-dependent oxidoreductase [Rhodopseudomonas palustris]|uniref:NAD(P)/FAD-dependent oxidoreductase n=1 Tax=Rhodopseudomonas palustris TaxID=1076 RepID=UPI00115E04A6|nr:FAD-dependent oxidoreductase [Rhodopseudomonas palustris]QDL96012.1 NAD(P)/FAD-dependent oxidoreductase [Rhodopseudomonas palustris]
MRNITIIGSGFAGLTAARELRKRKVDAEITMISPRRELHFLPSSIWIPAGIRQGERLKVPLDHFLNKHRIDFVEASVTGLKDGGRIAVTDRGELRNDHLIIATGGRFIRKLPGIEHALTPCEGIKVGEEIGRRLDALKGGTIAVGFATNPNEPGAMRGGPMFEFLFIIDTLLRQRGKRPGFEIVFFSPAPRPGARLGERAVDGLLREMKSRGIATRLGRKILRFEERKVVLEDGEIDADLILFMPGLTGPAWLENTELPLSAGGMIKADELCRVEALPNVWVAGDAGSFPGPDWMPKQAHQADLQAIALAANIAAIEAGQQPSSRFKPELVCIVDTLDSGMLVFRNERFNFVGPKMKLFHWLKRLFERHYLTTFR